MKRPVFLVYKPSYAHTVDTTVQYVCSRIQENTN
jgi:hypothetical protein